MKKYFGKKSEMAVWLIGATVFVAIIFVFSIRYGNRSDRNDETGHTSETTSESSTEKNAGADSGVNITDSEEPDQASDSEPLDTVKEQASPAQTAPAEPANIIPSTEPAPAYSSLPEPTCYHFENGFCWDDLEDEVYSAAQYDNAYGYYGASLDFPDNCDATCRDYLEDAYDEGWYDCF